MVDSILLDWQNYNQSFILTELHHWRSLNNLRVVSCVISDKIISATIQSFVFDTISVSRKSFHNWFLKGSQDASWKHQPRNFKTLNQTNDIWCRFTSQDHLNGHVNQKKTDLRNQLNEKKNPTLHLVSKNNIRVRRGKLERYRNDCRILIQNMKALRQFTLLCDCHYKLRDFLTKFVWTFIILRGFL